MYWVVANDYCDRSERLLEASNRMRVGRGRVTADRNEIFASQSRRKILRSTVAYGILLSDDLRRCNQRNGNFDSHSPLRSELSYHSKLVFSADHIEHGATSIVSSTGTSSTRGLTGCNFKWRSAKST
ncbi:hypothetical protein ACLOJK_012641 [Asimina triloba]